MAPTSSSTFALDFLSFCIADVQGLGALAGVYLAGTLGWSSTTTGLLLSSIELARVACYPFIGTGIDRSRSKRAWLTLAFLTTCATYVVLAATRNSTVVGFALVIQGAVSCVYGPGLAAVTLDAVGAGGFSTRCARNEVFRHLGMVVAGLLPIELTSRFGFQSFYVVLAIISAAAAAVGLTLNASGGHGQYVADGASGDRGRGGTAPSGQLLFRRDTLLVLLGFFFFWIANHAQLPVLGLEFDVLSKQPITRLVIFGTLIDGVVGVSLSKIIAELTMIPVVLCAKRMSQPTSTGLQLTFLASYATVPLRAFINSLASDGRVLLATQLLDATGAGVVSFLTAVTVEKLSRGTGHFAFLQGVGLACSGVGMAISTTLCGILVDQAGFATAFAALGVIGVFPAALISCLDDSTDLTANDPAVVARVKWTCLTIVMLCCSCAAMITAWYLHLKFESLSMPLAILLSWLIAGVEYTLQVPANRIGAHKAELKPTTLRCIAELATLVAFLLFQSFVLGQPVLLNHVLGFTIVFFGVLIVLAGPWTSPVGGSAEGAKSHHGASSFSPTAPDVLHPLTLPPEAGGEEFLSEADPPPAEPQEARC